MNTDPIAGAGLYPSLWRFARGARPALIAGAALLIASQALRLLLPWFAGEAINVLQAGAPGYALHAGAWIAALIATSVVVWALHGPGRVLERAVGVHVRRAITNALVDKLAAAPLKWHDRHPASDLQQRASQAADALDQFAQNQYVILQGVLTFVGTLVALVVFAPLTGVFAIVAYVALILVGTRFDRAMMRLTEEQNHAERRFSSGLLEFLGGIVTVSALRLESVAKRRVGTRLDAIFVPLKRSIRLNEAKWCAVDLLTTTLTWGVVALYVWQAQKAGPAVLIGGVFMIYKYAEQASTVVGSAASHFQTFAHFRVNFASAYPIWNAPIRPDPVAAPDADWTTIALHGVSYAHTSDTAPDDPAAEAKGIQRVDLAIHRGERIALVGPSGSGKSTLLRVMAGLYEADSGRMTVDGVAHLHVKPLAAMTTFVPQDPDVFEATVRENVAGDQEIDADALDRALRASALDAVLATMPAGLATPIAERGVNLSGGQRQRLGLARGILAASRSSLVLLDEPTSALDPLTEARIYGALRDAFPRSTVIASVHRMSALEHFDRVVLMADARVVDSGTIAEVRARQPLFAAMLQGVDVEDDVVEAAA